MTNKDLADLLFPNITKKIEDYEKMYPKRDIEEGMMVTRFAPSPTGRIHMGSLFAAFVPEVLANQSNGTYILRIEDTDGKREIENGIELILNDLKDYNFKIDEDPINGGEYGPYVQTERKEIYHTFVKYLIEIGRAYPCFCSQEELDNIRSGQESRKERIGYYGHYARCRNLSYEEVKKHIDNGDTFVIRLKSQGNFMNKMVLKDLIKGAIQLPENDIDQVIIKSDGIPPYALAHVVDDHLMRITHITRDDSYISSVPYHFELWDAFGFEKPKFAHILPLSIKDNGNIRKISKRKDPEAAISFYHEKGVPIEAIKLYLATLVNSNFEEWYLQNPDKSYRDFTFTFKKMSTNSPLFDLEKLLNISKNYLSRLTKDEIYDGLVKYTLEYDKEFYDLIIKYQDYTKEILNIEREQNKPRKDYTSYSDIRKMTWYMYDELFIGDFTYEFQKINDKDEIGNILKEYIENYYNENDDKETWFNKVKQLSTKFGCATDMKDYKLNPNNYKGTVSDIATVIRVGLTSKSATPDLYMLLKLIGKDRIIKRFKHFY